MVPQLRVIPKSHNWTVEQDAVFTADQERRRAAAGMPTDYSELAKQGLEGALEPMVPGEVSISLGPADLLVRRSTIYHATHANGTPDGRLMQHVRGDIPPHRVLPDVPLRSLPPLAN